MSQRLANETELRERLSALADGELDDGAVVHACAGWRDDASHQASWHAYHLIGDVLRSDDLASDGVRDAAFLAGLRARLATEPVVLAPPATPGVAATSQVVNAQRAGRWSWRASGAVAAGFVAVAAVVMVIRVPTSVAPSLALATPPVGVVQAASNPVVVPGGVTTVSTEPPAEPQLYVFNGRVVRDPKLDRYLAAHKQFAGTSALGVPSAFLSNATSDASNR